MGDTSMCSASVSYPDVTCLSKTGHIWRQFKTVKLSDSAFSYTFLTLSISIFNIVLASCCISFLFLICGLSSILCLSPLCLSLGMRMKTKPVLFFLQRALNISVLHFHCLFLCSLFFPRPLWCVCGFVIIPFRWAHRLRYTCTPSYSLTHSLFILETRSIHIQASILVRQYFPHAAPPTLQPIWFLNTLLTWKEYLHNQLQLARCALTLMCTLSTMCACKCL